ncbi:NUDIX hydrolase [Pseudoroseicyclus sp. H15]
MDAPIVAVLALVVREAEVLLVRRANPPDAGMWGFAGGKVEFGETLRAAAERELMEETGVTGRAGEVLTALEAWDREGGALRRHYVMVALRCTYVAGTPVAADDALEAAWVPLDRLETLDLSEDVAQLAHAAAGLDTR